jgi:hypothetical protein
MAGEFTEVKESAVYTRSNPRISVCDDFRGYSPISPQILIVIMLLEHLTKIVVSRMRLIEFVSVIVMREISTRCFIDILFDCDFPAMFMVL